LTALEHAQCQKRRKGKSCDVIELKGIVFSAVLDQAWHTSELSVEISTIANRFRHKDAEPGTSEGTHTSRHFRRKGTAYSSGMRHILFSIEVPIVRETVFHGTPGRPDGFLDVRAQRPALAEDCGETGDLLQLPEASPRM
jgi:hypothetical protein